MIGFILGFGFFFGLGVVSFISDMSRDFSAPQQCVAIASATFTIMAPYMAMKAYYCWRALENQKELLAAFKKISERRLF